LNRSTKSGGSVPNLDDIYKGENSVLKSNDNSQTRLNKAEKLILSKNEADKKAKEIDTKSTYDMRTPSDKDYFDESQLIVGKYLES